MSTHSLLLAKLSHRRDFQNRADCARLPHTILKSRLQITICYLPSLPGVLQ